MMTTMRARAWSGAVSCAAAMSVVACGGSESNSETYGEVSQAITGGTLVPTNVAPDESVVKISGCSGIKIGSKRFLTAGHCGWTSWVPGTTLSVTNSLSGEGGTNVTIAAHFLHPTEWFPQSERGTGNIHHDFHLVDVKETTSSIPVHNVLRPIPVAAGEKGYLTSYGCDNVSNNDGKKQYAPFTIGTDTTNPGYDLTWMFSPAGGGKPVVCPGDSGGPILFKRNSVWEIAGVVSFP